jgi:hypothetical protein
MYFIVAGLAGVRAGWAAAVLLNLLPAFNTAATTPTCTMPLAMCALSFLACAWRALDTSSPAWWGAAGLCAAGGLLFDYLAWFFWPALLLVMLASHRWRPRLLEPGIWIAALPTLGVITWLMFWNADHGWVHFIGGTWQTATSLDLRALPRGIYGAAFAASPLLLVAMAGGLYFALRDARVARRAKFLAIPASIAATVALYILLRGEPPQTAGLLAAALAIPLLAWLPAPGPWLTVIFVSAALWTAGYLAMQPARQATITREVTEEIEKLRGTETADAGAPVFLIAQNATTASAHLEVSRARLYELRTAFLRDKADCRWTPSGGDRGAPTRCILQGRRLYAGKARSRRTRRAASLRCQD